MPVLDIQAFALLPTSSDRKPLFQLRVVSLISGQSSKGLHLPGGKPLLPLKDWEADRCWRLLRPGGNLAFLATAARLPKGVLHQITVRIARNLKSHSLQLSWTILAYSLLHLL